MWLFVCPVDTLFFGGDGRQFEAGEDVWKRSIFPPYPHTTYGMIRALIALSAIEKPSFSDLLSGIKSEDLGEVLGTNDSLGTLSIMGPFCAAMMRHEFFPYLATPADLFFLSEMWSASEKEEFYLLSPQKEGLDLSEVTDIPIPLRSLGFPPDIEDKAHLLDPYEGFLSRRSLGCYLTCNDVISIQRESFLETEQVPIMAKDESGTTREHYLALPSHVRVSRGSSHMILGLAMFISGLRGAEKDLKDYFDVPRIARLGGEGRPVKVIRPKAELFAYHKRLKETLCSQITDTKLFRIILTSPAYFPKNMFYPDFIDKSLNGYWTLSDGDQVRVRLLALAMHRGVFVGGRDVQKNIPKKTVRMVPPGSVYYFELMCKQSEARDIATKMMESCFPGYLPGGDPEYNKKGFNTCIIGASIYV